jgi:hypothetical protein
MAVIRRTDERGNHINGIINSDGQILVPLRYEDTSWPFSGGLAAVKENGTWGIITLR